jgi:hypothetical protein
MADDDAEAIAQAEVNAYYDAEDAEADAEYTESMAEINAREAAQEKAAQEKAAAEDRPESLPGWMRPHA